MIATAASIGHSRPRAHAQSRRIVADLHASATAVALDLSASQLKHIARAGGISVSRASRWRTEGAGNPLFDTSQFVYGLAQTGQNPAAIVAHLTMILHHGMLGASDDALVQRFWLLMEEEEKAECRENTASKMLARTGDLAALRRALLDEASRQEQLAAVCLELERRGIDPTKYEQG
jgi:hypothetical protein